MIETKDTTTGNSTSSSTSPPPSNRKKHLVLVGGGHSHVYLLKQLGSPHYRQLLDEETNNIHVTLIAKDLWTPYSGMLPGFVAGHYSYRQIHIDLEKLCQASGITLIHAACQSIDYKDKSGSGGGGGIVHCDNDAKVPFDVLSIDVGSAPGATDPSIWQHPRIIPVKPIVNFCHFYERLQKDFMMNTTTTTSNSKKKKRTHRVCIVGGGAGGVELALSVQYNLQQLLLQNKTNDDNDSVTLQMVLITRGNTLLAGHNKRVQRILHRILDERGFEIHWNTTVTHASSSTTTNSTDDDVGQHFLHVEDDKQDSNTNTTTIPFDDCLWCTTAAGASWLSEQTPFDCDEAGFVKVNQFLQVLDHPGVFAAGDCAHNVDHPRPKAGVFAVRAGPPLLENVLAHLLFVLSKDTKDTRERQQPLQPFKAQSNVLALISTGNPYAIASKGNYFCLEGKWIWKWKDWIDRTWMAEYNTDI